MAAQPIHPYAARTYAEALVGAENVVGICDLTTPLLRRPIPAGGYDLVGPYPMTVFKADEDLASALHTLRSRGYVSLVCVPDPLGSSPAGGLRSVFDLCRPLKAHYVVDPAKGLFDPTKHHRDRIRRGLRRCRVDLEPLANCLGHWRDLYAELVTHRSITGAANFSEAYFDMLSRLEALKAFVARCDGAIVGMTLWFSAGGVAYNHLTAVNAAGYRAGASYVLYDAAITHFAADVINLGGGAGAGDGTGGLADFKRGFANEEVQAMLCGAVLDADAYFSLARPYPNSDFFPAYRTPSA